MADRLKEAQALNAGVAEAEQLNALQREAFFKQLTDAQAAALEPLLSAAEKLALTAARADIDAARAFDADLSRTQALIAEQERLKDAFDRAGEEIAKFRDGLALSPYSPLSPEDRLGAARSGFFATRDAAAGGDIEALQRLTQEAEAFLAASRAFNASSAAYAGDFAAVQGALGGALSGVDLGKAAADAQAALLGDQVDLLTQIRDLLAAAGTDDARVAALELELDRLRGVPASAAALGLSLGAAPANDALAGASAGGAGNRAVQEELRALRDEQRRAREEMAQMRRENSALLNRIAENTGASRLANERMRART